MNNPEVRDLQSLRPMAVEYSQVGWEDVKRFLRSYYRLIIGIFLATVISAYVSLNFMTELYSAEAELGSRARALLYAATASVRRLRPWSASPAFESAAVEVGCVRNASEMRLIASSCRPLCNMITPSK